MFNFEKQSREDLASLTRDQLLEVLADNLFTAGECKIDVKAVRKMPKAGVLTAALEIYDARRAIIEIEARQAAERKRRVIQAEAEDKRCVAIREGLQTFAHRICGDLAERQEELTSAAAKSTLSSWIRSNATDVFMVEHRLQYAQWLSAWSSRGERYSETIDEMRQTLAAVRQQETDHCLSESFGQSSSPMHNVDNLEEHKARAWFVKVLARVLDLIERELGGDAQPWANSHWCL